MEYYSNIITSLLGNKLRMEKSLIAKPSLGHAKPPVIVFFCWFILPPVPPP
jgi:hypothetical protein